VIRVWTTAAFLLSATPAAALEVYCLSDADVSWHKGGLRSALRATDAHGFSGWHEFWVDTETGDWKGRTIGSRALYSAGGTFEIVNDGSAYGADWIGLGENGFTILRIDLGGGTEAGFPFLRSDRNQEIRIGLCRDTVDGDFLDGEPRP